MHINGHGPFHFVVDTGADRTILASEVAVELGLSQGEKVMLKGVVRAVLTEAVAIRTMTFGSITKRRLLVPTLSRSLLDADGYLGLDFLDGHRVTFDFKNHLLQVSEPRTRFSANWVRENEARIRAPGSFGHLQALDCMVDDIPATAFDDLQAPGIGVSQRTSACCLGEAQSILRRDRQHSFDRHHRRRDLGAGSDGK